MWQLLCRQAAEAGPVAGPAALHVCAALPHGHCSCSLKVSTARCGNGVHSSARWCGREREVAPCTTTWCHFKAQLGMCSAGAAVATMLRIALDIEPLINTHRSLWRLSVMHMTAASAVGCCCLAAAACLCRLSAGSALCWILCCGGLSVGRGLAQM